MMHVPIPRTAGIAALALTLFLSGTITATAAPTPTPTTSAAASSSATPTPTTTAAPTPTASPDDIKQVIGPNDKWNYYYGEDYDRKWMFLSNNKHGMDRTEYKSGAQPLGYGSSFIRTELIPATSPRPRTAYFKNYFYSPPDLWAWKELRLSLTADDGYALYFNGHEEARVNLPAGTLTNSTYATAAPRTAQARTRPTVVTIPVAYLATDEEINLLTVEVHANYRATPDMSFQLTAELIPNPQRIVTTTGSTWFYHYQNDPVAEDWKTSSNLGNNYKEGISPLGFGDPSVRTDLDIQPASARPLTAYFSRRFPLGEKLDAFGDLEITVWANDGMVIYVDGKEVKRINMPPGAITASTYATAAPSALSAAKNPITFTVPRSTFGQLSYSTVHIAVEVHLNWRGTRDMVFDLTARSLGPK